MMALATAIAVALLIVGPVLFLLAWRVTHHASRKRAAQGGPPIVALHERRGAFLAGFLSTGALAVISTLRAFGAVQLEPPVSTFVTAAILAVNAAAAAGFLWLYYTGRFGTPE